MGRGMERNGVGVRMAGDDEKRLRSTEAARKYKLYRGVSVPQRKSILAGIFQLEF